MIKDTQGRHCVTTNEFKDVLQGSQIGDGVKQYCLTLQLLDRVHLLGNQLFLPCA